MARRAPPQRDWGAPRQLIELIYNNTFLIILVGSFFIIITKTVKGHGDGKTLNVVLLYFNASPRNFAFAHKT